MTGSPDPASLRLSFFTICPNRHSIHTIVQKDEIRSAPAGWLQALQVQCTTCGEVVRFTADECDRLTAWAATVDPL